jgi:hypothetical protein
MRDPLALKEAEIKDQKYTILKIDQVPEFDIQDYDLMDSKEFQKYISNIEKIVRSSFEYRTLIQYIRENMDMNKCSFFENVNNIDTSKVRIEIHHHPFTLYELVVIVYNKRQFMREPIDDELVAKEVMYLHYALLVGLIPLSETVHELVHNQYLFIPNDKVMGRYEEFYNLYKEFMTPEIIDVYERTVEFSKSYDIAKQNKLLDTSYIYIDLTGAYDIPTYQQVIDSMNNRIKHLKATNNVEIVPESSKKTKVISFCK